MRFNPKARLDTSQIRDSRGRRSSGGLGGGRISGMPGGLPAGGGVLGLIVTIVILVVINTSGGGPTDTTGSAADATNLSQCRTGADTNRDDCRLVAEVNSIQDYWEETLPRQAGQRYRESDTTLFSGQVATQCGNASSAVGPFYCPADDSVYIDKTFFDQMLTGELGARGGDFAEAYILAHEYGHHIQDLLGTMAQVRSRQGATSDAVRLELQADCYAGMWAKGATTADDDTGEAFILELTRDDIARAINAARAVGDDRIQQHAQGRVNPDAWTHGSSEQRMRWFLVGYERGSLDACDTFSAAQL